MVLLLSKKVGAPINASTLKASAGLAEHLDIMFVPSAQHAASLLKSAGYNLYLAVVNHGTDALTTKYSLPLCLVIGSEGVGISQDIRSQGACITLPQKDTSSYNASVAAGILLFLVAHQCKKI